jgi:hypothetical protein
VCGTGNYNRFSLQKGLTEVVVRLGVTITAAASVLAGKAMIAAGLRRPPEGWRRTVGILLRSESTRFALSVFGLRVPAAGSAVPPGRDPFQFRTAQALQAFLASEPDAHFTLEWLRPVTNRRRIQVLDLVVLQFGPDGRLDAIDPYLAPSSPQVRASAGPQVGESASPHYGSSPPPSDVCARVHDAIVQGYNKTSTLLEVDRPERLLDGVRAGLTSAGVRAYTGYAQRLVAASCLSFEPIDPADPAQRFRPPPFAARRTLGFGYLSWVARAGASDTLDLWASAHHVGLDGVPLQELLDRLERTWGAGEIVAFPAPAPGRAFIDPHPCHAPGEREVDQLVTFVDLAPVFALREGLNARHAGALDGHVTFGTLIAWLLSQEPEFAGVRIASTVDVPASAGYERDVDVVSLRAADFATGDGPWGGFVEYAREFNRLIAAARARTSPVRVGMQTAGLIPAWAHAAVVRANPSALDDTFGTLCVTIVREARVFIAPMTDLGLTHGFFAIGSARLPSGTGTAVTSVSVKGEAGRIAHYPAILQRLIERAAALKADVTS